MGMPLPGSIWNRGANPQVMLPPTPISPVDQYSVSHHGMWENYHAPVRGHHPPDAVQGLLNMAAYNPGLAFNHMSFGGVPVQVQAQTGNVDSPCHPDNASQQAGSIADSEALDQLETASSLLLHQPPPHPDYTPLVEMLHQQQAVLHQQQADNRDALDRTMREVRAGLDARLDQFMDALRVDRPAGSQQGSDYGDRRVLSMELTNLPQPPPFIPITSANTVTLVTTTTAPSGGASLVPSYPAPSCRPLNTVTLMNRPIATPGVCPSSMSMVTSGPSMRSVTTDPSSQLASWRRTNEVFHAQYSGHQPAPPSGVVHPPCPPQVRFSSALSQDLRQASSVVVLPPTYAPDVASTAGATTGQSGLELRSSYSQPSYTDTTVWASEDPNVLDPPPLHRVSNPLPRHARPDPNVHDPPPVHRVSNPLPRHVGPDPKLPPYNGKVPWRAYELQLDQIAAVHHLDSRRTLALLVPVLRDRALTFFSNLSREVRGDYQLLRDKFRARFGASEPSVTIRMKFGRLQQEVGEELEEFAERTEELATLGWGDYGDQVSSTMASEQFLRGCLDHDSALVVVNRGVESLDEALRLMKMTTHNRQALNRRVARSPVRTVSFAATPSPTPTRSLEDEVVGLRKEFAEWKSAATQSRDDEILKLKNELARLRQMVPKPSGSGSPLPRSSPRGQPGSPRRCFNCTSIDHLVRDCPLPRNFSPRPSFRPSSPGNSVN